MRSPLVGYYSPEAYYYDKSQDILKRTVCVEFKRVMGDEDWAWEETPILKEITDPKEKKRILKEHPKLLEERAVW